DDVDVDRHLTHHVTHLLASVFHRKEWLYSLGFVDEGLAHWFEMRYFANADNSCNQEEVEEDFGNQNWHQLVLAGVQSGSNPTLAQVTAKRTDQLKGTDHAYAWSLCDFLLSHDPARFADLMARLKEKAEWRDALRSLYGNSIFELEGSWR